MYPAGQRAIVALLTFICVLCFGGCKQAGLQKEPRPKWPVTSIPWEHPPVVKVCNHSPVSPSQVQYSLDLWHSHGAPQLTAVASACSSTYEEAVYVGYPTDGMLEKHWDANMVGLTVVYSKTKWGPPSAADMGLLSDDMRVLTHEVGHLWLPGHYPGKDHVLAEWMANFDWNGWDGVEKAFR